MHQSLQDEWQPSGALEEDAVYTILTCIWRKRRIRDKRDFDTLAVLQEKEFVDLTAQPVPLFDTSLETTIHLLKNRPSSSGDGISDRASDLLHFSNGLHGRMDLTLLNAFIRMLGEEFSTHLNREVPKENYPTIPDWVVAIKHEVDEVLLPGVGAEMASPVKAAAFLTTDRIIADLVLEQRLDAMIDRAIHRLAQAR